MHHRRKRPRRQPASVMSSPDRVFGEPRDNTIEESECSSSPRPKRKREWVIQRRYIRANSPAAAFMSKTYARLREWNNYRRYYTQKNRDEALRKLASKDTDIWEYRTADPD